MGRRFGGMVSRSREGKKGEEGEGEIGRIQNRRSRKRRKKDWDRTAHTALLYPHSPDFSTHPFPTERGFRRYIPLVLMCAIREASSMLTSSPIVTKS
jgi:hypothetical protein